MPYNVEDYAHGKLYVIWQVVESVNDAFKGILDIKFTDSQIIHYDECKTKDGILALAQDILQEEAFHLKTRFKQMDPSRLFRISRMKPKKL